MRYLAIVLSLMCVLEIIVKNWSYIIKKSMTYKIYLDKQKAFVGEDVRIVTEITNGKVIPIPWIKIKIEVPVHFRFNNSKVEIGDEERNLFKIITSLLGFQKLERGDSFKCNKRGAYTIKAARSDIGDFLGLQETILGVKVENELIVYPKIKDVIELIDIFKTLQGEVSVRRWIINDPIQVIGSRKYTNEDSFNTIDWKLSAKNGELYVKKFYNSINYILEQIIYMLGDIVVIIANWINESSLFKSKQWHFIPQSLLQKMGVLVTLLKNFFNLILVIAICIIIHRMYISLKNNKAKNNKVNTLDFEKRLFIFEINKSEKTKKKRSKEKLKDLHVIRRIYIDVIKTLENKGVKYNSSYTPNEYNKAIENTEFKSKNIDQLVDIYNGLRYGNKTVSKEEILTAYEIKKSL